MQIKARNIVFVHGIFGWGPDELGPLPYWGDALSQFDRQFDVHEAKCGPISSFHDRACELFAQIRGGAVDYGAEHSAAAGHARISPTLHFEDGFVSDWSAQNPIVLVGHSAGAHACLQLQTLLAQDFWRIGTSADWVEAVVCVAGVLNGSTLTYKFGCDESTGLITGAPERLINATVDIIDYANRLRSFLPFGAGPSGIKLWLDQWRGDTERFVSGADNLAYDLTLQGCREANSRFETHKSSYYLSLVTSERLQEPIIPYLNIKVPFAPKHWGDMNPLLRGGATYQAEEADFAARPIPNWGTTSDLSIDAWRENDGAVSSISQRYPFTHHDEPLGGKDIFGRAEIEKGKWYFERVENVVGQRFDHLDPAFGGLFKPRVRDAHKLLYQKLSDKLSGRETESAVDRLVGSHDAASRTPRREGTAP